MNNLITFSPLIFFSLLLIVLIYLKIFTKTYNNKYQKKSLMTNNEFEFFNRLIKALPEYYIFSQVSMAAILDVDRKNTNIKYIQAIRNTFDRKIIDYVVYNKNKEIVAIIELDDRTHNPEKDKKRDSMLWQAGYRTIRFQSKNKPTIEEIRKLFFKI